MPAVTQRTLHLACEFVWALDVGIAITLMLTILRAAGIAPGITDFLLRLGWHMLPGAKNDVLLANTVFILISALAYGLLAFAAIHLWWNRGRTSPQPKIERRRRFRVALATPVFVYGWSRSEPFTENTETVNVSEVGGLIPISAEVDLWQELILTNVRTEKDVSCRVARLSTREDGKTLAGLAFHDETPDFWEIEFVPVTAAGTPSESAAPEARMSAR